MGTQSLTITEASLAPLQSATFTVPSGVYDVRVICIGKGGPGSNGSTMHSTGGTGGGGGGYAFTEVHSSPHTQYTVAINSTYTGFSDDSDPMSPIMLCRANVGGTGSTANPGAGVTGDILFTGGTGAANTGSAGGGGGGSARLDTDGDDASGSTGGAGFGIYGAGGNGASTGDGSNAGGAGGGGGGGGGLGVGSVNGGLGGQGLIVLEWDDPVEIGFDAKASSGFNNHQTGSWTHLSTGGPDSYLLVGISIFSAYNTGGGMDPNNYLMPTVTSIKCNDVDLSFIGAQDSDDANNANRKRVEMWGMIDPGPGDIDVLIEGMEFPVWMGTSLSFVGVNQSMPYEGLASAQAINVGADDATVDVTTTAADDWIIDCISSTDTTITVGTGQTQATIPTDTMFAGASGNMSYTSEVDAGTEDMYWTDQEAGATWAIIALGLRNTLATGGPTTYNETATGGTVGAGSGVAQKISLLETSGGIVGGSAANAGLLFESTMAGGSVSGSSADLLLVRILIASGGSVGASSAVASVHRILDSSGGIQGAGAAVDTTVLTTFGGAVSGSTADVNFIAQPTVSGGARSGGNAWYDGADIVAAGAVSGGLALVKTFNMMQTSGGIVAAGVAADATIITGSGSVLGSGVAENSVISANVSTGGSVSAGIAAVSTFYTNYDASGGSVGAGAGTNTIVILTTGGAISAGSWLIGLTNFAIIGTGTALGAGSADVFLITTKSATGGSLGGGIALNSRFNTEAVSGGIVAAGGAIYGISFVDTSSGGLIVTGSHDLETTRVLFYDRPAANFRIKIGGSGTLNYAKFEYASSPRITIAGASDIVVQYNDRDCLDTFSCKVRFPNKYKECFRPLNYYGKKSKGGLARSAKPAIVPAITVCQQYLYLPRTD